jgi:demethylmenaquinone methyltransferase/2-methoxy-6-polyprenyl-1,4-benzoquinol methylase
MTYRHDALSPSYEGAAKTERVRTMFDRIAGRYDTLNRLISLGIDARWRDRVVRTVVAHGATSVLDVATGTADLAIAMAAAGIPDVVGVDLSPGMLAVGREKVARTGLGVRLELADAAALPFEDASFDAITVAFGVRNFEDLGKGLRELVRVLRPGGLIAVLELSTPTAPLLRAAHRFYTMQILPRVGALVSGEGAAYRYLPASVAAFPDPPAFREALVAAGAERPRTLPLTFGVASLHLATRPRTTPG